MSSDAALLAQIMDKLNQTLAALDRIERSMSDPEEVRQAIADITAGYALTAQLAEVAGVQREQILHVVEWIQKRMNADELRARFDNLAFVTQQLGSISQRWRDDLLLMRADVRRLATLTEIALHQLPTDDPDVLPDDVRAVLEARRLGRQRMNAILGILLIARERGEAPPDLEDEFRELETTDAAMVAMLRRAVNGEETTAPG